MKRMIAGLGIVVLLAVALVPAWAGGDKVRGENGDGAVNQVGFDNQDNQN